MHPDNFRFKMRDKSKMSWGKERTPGTKIEDTQFLAALSYFFKLLFLHFLKFAILD